MNHLKQARPNSEKTHFVEIALICILNFGAVHFPVQKYINFPSVHQAINTWLFFINWIGALFGKSFCGSLLASPASLVK